MQPTITSDRERHMKRRVRASMGLVFGMLATIALASFSVGIATSRAYDHYARRVDCQRWRENVDRWAQVVDDASGELRPVETTVLVLAHGGMTAVRDQVCGF